MAKTKYILLLPVKDNEGNPVLQATIDGILKDLYVLAGGYTIAGTVTGAYRMQHGGKQVDQSLAIWIGIEERQEASLKRLVASIGRTLKQEMMYLERTGGTMEYVSPLAPDEKFDEEES